MTQELLRSLAKQLNKNKFLLAKPSQDVFQIIQAFVLLVKGIKTNDWLLAQLLMSCSLTQMVELIIQKKIENTNIIQCRKLINAQPPQMSPLGRQVYQLVTVSLDFLQNHKNEIQRSKSTFFYPDSHTQQISRSNLLNKYASQVKLKEVQHKTNIGEKIQSEKQIAEENRKYQELKKKMKSLNRNNYFVSPKKIQHDQEIPTIRIRNNYSERSLIQNKQMRSLRSFRQSFYD